jgi:hypothetical protein
MNIGDLVKDKDFGLGIIIDLQWDDDHDEILAVLQLSNNTQVLCSHEDIEVINEIR